MYCRPILENDTLNMIFFIPRTNLIKSGKISTIPPQLCWSRFSPIQDATTYKAKLNLRKIICFLQLIQTGSLYKRKCTSHNLDNKKQWKNSGSATGYEIARRILDLDMNENNYHKRKQELIQFLSQCDDFLEVPFWFLIKQ